MRVLHTADWHLGASTGPASRIEEQEWFLDWLLDTVKEKEIDALLIAGDVFDSMYPSAEAQRAYYRFLGQIVRAGVRDVVVVGGNHDSPSHLDAPRAVLEALDVYVVGGIPLTEDRLDRMIAPLHARGSDEISAICLAVPYVHEYRLGIRTSDLDRDKTRDAFRSAFKGLYTDLADRAIERFGDLPLIATGHLTMGSEVKREDYQQEIHQVATIEGLPADILDPRIRYTALGHIHRCYPIAGSTAWYSGTPIPYSLTEMSVARQVLVVDVRAEVDTKVERLEVPQSRDLVQLMGTPEEVLAMLEGLAWSTRLPPLVHVRVLTDMAEPGLARRLHEAVASHSEHSRPILVEVQQRAAHPELEVEIPAVPSLESLEPDDVFGLMCDAQRIQGDDRLHLESAFNQIAQATGKILEEMIEAIELPPSAQGNAP